MFEQDDDVTHGSRLLSLPGLESVSARLRTAFINIGFFAATLLLIPSIASQFTRTAVIVDPIAVPQVLIDRGMTPDVVANRVWDGLQEFSGTARLARATIVAIPDSQLVEFSLPDTGISINSLFKQIRQFFGLYETRITGEIICDTRDCVPTGLLLRLRVKRTDTEIIDLPTIGRRPEADYFRDAAAGVFDILDPFVAIAALSLTDPEEAALRARHFSLSGHADAKWAHNLLGDMARQAGDLPAAMVDYQAALALDPAFDIARINLALAQAGLGDFDAAALSLADAQARGASGTELPKARAELALAMGNPSLAITHLLAATQRDPLDAPLLAHIGDLELQIGRRDEAIGHLREALALDPGEASALRLLGQTFRAEGDLAAAQGVFRDWADYVPTSVEAHLSLAELLTERNDPEAAASAYARAIALDPANVAIILAQARTMLALGRYAQAVDGLTPLADAEPADPAALLLLAQVQDQAGRLPLAAIRYRQYLDLVPEGPEAETTRTRLAEMKDEL